MEGGGDIRWRSGGSITGSFSDYFSLQFIEAPGFIQVGARGGELIKVSGMKIILKIICGFLKLIMTLV